MGKNLDGSSRGLFQSRFTVAALSLEKLAITGISKRVQPLEGLMFCQMNSSRCIKSVEVINDLKYNYLTGIFILLIKG